MKKVIKTIFSALAWIVLIFALIITLLVFTADRNNGVSNLLGFIPLTVESDSMKPTFSKDDMIIDREIDDINSLKVDDVITFWTLIDGKKVKNTHRIVEINDNGTTKNFVTRGDNNGRNDDISVYPADIIGKWTNVKIGGFGKIMSYLRTKTGFFICILLPMALFFLFELYKLIATIIEIKRPELTAEDEEEIKRRAVEEYLKEQKEKEEAAKKAAEPDKDAEPAAEAAEPEKDAEPAAEAAEPEKDAEPAAEAAEPEKDAEPAAEAAESEKDAEPAAEVTESENSEESSEADTKENAPE